MDVQKKHWNTMGMTRIKVVTQQRQRETPMRKILAGLITLAVLGLAVPIAGSSSADARHYRAHKKVVVMKTHHNRGLHRGWYKKGRHHGTR
jgi:hypothetical protein